VDHNEDTKNDLHIPVEKSDDGKLSINNKENNILYVKTNVPQTYKQALESADREKWKIAITKEFKNIYDNHVTTVVDSSEIPKDANILDGTWVFTIKDDGIRKARFVIRGFKQIKGKDFIDTYAPTLQSDSLRITIAIASIMNWNIMQIDIKAAYLNAELKEKIFVKIPEGDKNFNKEKYWLLNKALYGLKQSGRAWNKEITKFLKSIGLHQLDTDECIFCKYNKNHKLYAILNLYVDDILLTGNEDEIKEIINKIKRKYKISKESIANKIIGINIMKAKKGYKINQKDYIDKIVKKYMMHKTKRIYTPCHRITMEQRENSRLVDVTSYKSLLGALLYIAVKTRPGIAFSVNQLARNCEKPTKADYDSAMMTLQYLKSTKEKSIYYNGNETLVGYSDSDWGGDESTRRSTSGFIFLLGNAPIVWKSQTQKCVTLSSAEAECVSLIECTKHALKLRKIIKEITNKELNIKIFVDNNACKAMVEIENARGRIKHMDIKYKFIYENITKNKINLEKIESNKMAADPLTKCISGPKMSIYSKYIFD